MLFAIFNCKTNSRLCDLLLVKLILLFEEQFLHCILRDFILVDGIESIGLGRYAFNCFCAELMISVEFWFFKIVFIVDFVYLVGWDGVVALGVEIRNWVSVSPRPLKQRTTGRSPYLLWEFESLDCRFSFPTNCFCRRLAGWACRCRFFPSSSYWQAWNRNFSESTGLSRSMVLPQPSAKSGTFFLQKSTILISISLLVLIYCQINPWS